MQKNNLLNPILLLIPLFFYPILVHTQASNESEVYKKLISELRCMVCQNQNLEESEAPLAVDLKNKIKLMLREGKSEDEIKKFLVDRYSSFILYEPPFTNQIINKWDWPFLLLLNFHYFVFLYHSLHKPKHWIQTANFKTGIFIFLQNFYEFIFRHILCI